MPTRRTNTFQCPFCCCLATLHEGRKKNAAALVTQKIRVGSQAPLRGRGEGLLPLSEDNGALAAPRRSAETQTLRALAPGALPVSAVLGDNPPDTEKPPCANCHATLCKQINLSPARCLLPPTTRRVPPEAPNPAELYGPGARRASPGRQVRPAAWMQERRAAAAPLPGRRLSSSPFPLLA